MLISPWNEVQKLIRDSDVTEVEKQQAWANIRKLYRRAAEILGPSLPIENGDPALLSSGTEDVLRIYETDPSPFPTSAAEIERYNEILKYNCKFRNMVACIESTIGKWIPFPDQIFLDLAAEFRKDMIIAEETPAPTIDERRTLNKVDVVVVALDELEVKLDGQFWTILEQLIGEVVKTPTRLSESVSVGAGKDLKGIVAICINDEEVWSREIWDIRWAREEYEIGPWANYPNAPSEQNAFEELRRHNAEMKKEQPADVHRHEFAQRTLDWIDGTAVDFAGTEEERRRNTSEPSQPTDEDEVVEKKGIRG